MKAVARRRRARRSWRSSAPRTPATPPTSSTRSSRDWIATARHPKFNRPYTEMVYQPMLELLAYLRANGFKTFIVSGGGVEFMRPVGRARLRHPAGAGHRQPRQDEVRGARRRSPCSCGCRRSISSTTRPGSRSGIQQSSAAGRSRRSATPTATSRCSSGRRQAPGRASALIVHHTDAEREWAYDRTSHVGQLARGLDEARSAAGSSRHEARLERDLPVPETMTAIGRPGEGSQTS